VTWDTNDAFLLTNSITFFRLEREFLPWKISKVENFSNINLLNKLINTFITYWFFLHNIYEKLKLR